MREALDEFIGASPQPRIDIDGIALRARARRRRRRVVTACLAGLAVAAVATTVPLMFGGGHATTYPDAVFAFDLATLKWQELYAPTPCTAAVMNMSGMPASASRIWTRREWTSPLSSALAWPSP